MDNIVVAVVFRQTCVWSGTPQDLQQLGLVVALRLQMAYKAMMSPASQISTSPASVIVQQGDDAETLSSSASQVVRVTCLLVWGGYRDEVVAVVIEESEEV